MSRSTSQMALAMLNEAGRAGARPTSHVHLGEPRDRGMLPERSRARLVPGKGVLLSVHEDPGVAGHIGSAVQQGPR